MALLLSSAISVARGILSDTGAVLRYSDADLLEYANGALRALTELKPNLLYVEGDVACVAGSALQSVGFADIHSIADVVRVKNGNTLTPADKASMDSFVPGWMQATAAAARNWLPHASDPFKFYVYPPAPAGQTVVVLYVRVPGPYTSTEDTGLPESLTDAVASYIVGMAESRDDEHVNSGRAAQFLNQFSARLGVAPAKG